MILLKEYKILFNFVNYLSANAVLYLKQDRFREVTTHGGTISLNIVKVFFIRDFQISLYNVNDCPKIKAGPL
jgi:hypothetical protein